MKADNKNIARWRTRALIGLAAVVVIAAGIATIVAVSGGDDATSTDAPVYAFADPAQEVGTSTLTRNDADVRMQFETDDLAADETITMWWVVFNEPDACTDACDTDDLFVDGDPAGELNAEQIEAADIVAAYAAGGVASSSGGIALSAALEENESPGTREIIFGDEVALKDADAAEIHFVARSHGVAIPELVEEQIGSFAGGCEVFLNPPDRPTGPGECADVLFAVHLP